MSGVLNTVADQSEWLPTLFAELLAAGLIPATGWRLGSATQRSTLWTQVINEQAPLPAQGWKLHISAGLPSAAAVMRVALPLLLNAAVNFKIVASIDQLRNLNNGRYGYSQIGKFITVYPCDDAQALELASALDRATRGLRGPTPPSDRRLNPQSLVSYRYGAFQDQAIHLPNGQVVFGVQTPSGEWRQDQRSARYVAPEDRPDPFIAAGVATPLADPVKLIGARYLLTGSLSQSPRGKVYRALDLVSLKTVIIKQAAPDALLQFDGSDALDVLRGEATVLASLAPDSRFPAPLDLIAQDGDLFLALEELPGVTLEKKVTLLFGQGRPVAAAQIINWGRELTDMLATVHAARWVYRDLKSTNILVDPDNRLRLIDFDLARTPDAQDDFSDVGTRGYMSPQQQAGEPASFADDIYGLGAVLYFIATRAEPSQAPLGQPLPVRPISLINPAISPALEKLILACLAPDPADRPQSMAAVAAMFADLSANASQLVSTSAPAHPVEPAADIFAENARRLGATLFAIAQRDAREPGCFWPSAHRYLSGIRSRDLYSGSAGPTLALAELLLEFDDSALRQTLAEAAHWLISSSRPHGAPLPGLYVGEAGVGAALLRASQALNDPELLNAACAQGAWVAKQPFASPDLIHGAAGRIRFHLLLWDATNDPEHLAAARAAGHWLIEMAQDSGAGLCWPLPPEFGGETFVGYGHGSAGIADSLLDLYEASGDAVFLPAIQGAARLLTNLAAPVLADNSGLNWPRTKGEPLGRVFWCHGAAGVGLFFQHAATLDVVPGAADIAASAARTAAQSARWASPTQCHGLSGNIEFLLDMFQATGNPSYKTDAFTLAQLIAGFSQEKDNQLVYPADAAQIVTPDYMLGFAGLIPCFLRLADPERRPTLISRAGFRYRLKVSTIYRRRC